MRYRQMPTGEELSLLGFGAMRLPVLESGSEEIDEVKAVEMIDYAFSSGVNYYDSAWPYHEGLSESFLGQALVGRYAREQYYLATKLPVWEIASAEHAESLFGKQLRKLNTDYIDFYLMHALDDQWFEHAEKLGLYKWLCRKQEQGLVRRIGFSFHGSINSLEKIIDAHDWDFAQIQLNYLDWDLQRADRAYELLAEAGIPVVVMEPLRGGTLAKLSPAAEGILRTAAPDRSLASWALRFAAGLPNVVTVLSGMTTLEQLEDNVATLCVGESTLPLSEHERSALDSAIEVFSSAGTIPCSACRYCMPCPQGVDITRVFGFYNQFILTGAAFPYKLSMDLLGQSAWPDKCSDCGQCLEKCTQHIDIPGYMKKIDGETRELVGVAEFRAARAERISDREEQQ